MLIITSLVISACLNSALDILKHNSWAKNIPIRSYIQVVKLILFLITTIFVLSIMLDKSPWAFLSGLGAMTAIILLVFKDTILSFVAGIQLSANNLVKEGDWIEMPKYGADGDEAYRYLLEQAEKLRNMNQGNPSNKLVFTPKDSILKMYDLYGQGMEEYNRRNFIKARAYFQNIFILMVQN